MKEKISKKNKKISKSPIFIIALLNFLIIVLGLIYMIYLRFVPFETIKYDGYAVSGKELLNNLLNTTFKVDQSIDALEVKDQDDIYQNLNAFYLGASKEKNINLNYPIYVNDNLALYNLSKDTILINSDLQKIEGYAGFTLTAGALYNSNTMERADYHDYILMKNSDGLYINTQEIKIKTLLNKYKIGINSIINFSDNFITFYTLKDGKFFYNKIIDVDESSTVNIEYFNRKYSYKEFLLGLNIIREENKKDSQEENETEENTEVKEGKNELQENKVNTEEKEENKTGRQGEGTEEKKWQKPEVSCSEFNANVYYASAEVTIKDFSSVISKSVIFSFYKEDSLSFRLPMASTGTVKATQLVPNTKYTVIGNYQYQTEDGRIIENEFTKQEFTTKDTGSIKEIDISVSNDIKYKDKIELLNMRIVSDIEDEAILGISRATIKLNNTEYSMDSITLRNLLEGKVIKKFTLSNGVDSNTNYKYEIIFYDTANNKMKTIHNTGNTYTLKSTPYALINHKNVNINEVKITIELKNKDNIKMSNYRYILFKSDGEQIAKSELSMDERAVLTFKELDPNNTYTINVYADYNMEDGNGNQENQEIGTGTFNTISIEQLGKLYLNLSYDFENDLKSNEIKLKGKIDTRTTDRRLLPILQELTININDNLGKTVWTNTKGKEDINNFRNEQELPVATGLNSNTTYSIEVKAKVKQGKTEEYIQTDYDLKDFTTRKQTPKYGITNMVTTNNKIDFSLYIDDPDNAGIYSSEEKAPYTLKLNHKKPEDSGFGFVEKIDKIKANELKLISFDETEADGEYRIDIIANDYNDTNYPKNRKRYIQIGNSAYIYPSGVTGSLDLIDLKREQNSENKNLIDITANNNWYSKCFDIVGKNNFNYGKTYEIDSNSSTLTLTGEQCYLYDFKNYKGEKVTISFQLTEGNTDKLFIQEGKIIQNNQTRIPLSNINYDNDNKIYYYTTEIPDNGYLGFYIEGNNIISIKNLQVELGEERTQYSSTYLNPNESTNPKSTIKYEINSNQYVSFDDLDNKYYIIVNGTQYDNIENNEFIYEIQNNNTYNIQLACTIYGKEYILDEISFEYNGFDDTNNNEESKYSDIKHITNIEEYTEMQPDGNYFISSKVLNLQNDSTKSQYTFGNKNIKFNGTINYDGNLIQKDITYDSGKKQNTSYLFHSLGQDAKLTNLVLDFYINDKNKNLSLTNVDNEEEKGIYGIFLHNEGNISNIMVNLRACRDKVKRYVGLIGYSNTGIIDRFAICLYTDLQGNQYITGGCYESSGTIKNGYLGGDSRIRLNSSTPIKESRNSAGIVYKLLNGGTLKNVFNICELRITHKEQTDSFAANIAYSVEEGATIDNIYSVGNCGVPESESRQFKYIDQSDEKIDAGPNIFYCKNNNSSEELKSYYFADHMYETR